MSKTINTNKKAKKSARSWLPWVIILIAFAGLVIFSLLPSKEKPLSGPRFQKEGTLQFIGSQEQIIQTIDIEIADNEFDQAQGLMWRKSMEEHQGMLFVMEKMEEQSFWMLNTYIALDIIFLDDDLEIVKIKANTQPQSLDAIKSERPAQYVLEVNAGYCEKYNINEGDKIQFKRK